MLSVSTDEPGVPGTFDEDNRPYFFPARQRRDADNAEQREGFIARWEYRGHSDGIKDVWVAGEDSFGRMRCVSTDGRSIHSWLEFSDSGSVKTPSAEHSSSMINAITFIPHLNTVAAASGDSLMVFDGRTMRCLATLSTSKKVLLQLQYNHARDEIISGGSDGCFVWRLAVIPCELYAPELVPFELTLLHGFKGCSHWAGKMVFDERAQVIITIDGMRVQTYDATAATTNRHTIEKAHESPVTVGLWVGESEHIVTGCMGGLLKIWACQHTDVHREKQDRRGRRHKKKPRRLRSHRQGHGQSPALVESFEGHFGVVTGLVRHCLNRSYIVSSGADGTLRVWDVDRLALVTNVRLPCAVASLWAFSGLGGQFRLVCAGAEGSIRTMVSRQICQPLSIDTDGAGNVRYFPPVGGNVEGGGSVSATEKDDEDSGKENWNRDPRQVGLILVLMKHGLWGLLSEQLLLPTSTDTAANKNTSVPPTTTKCVTQADAIQLKIDDKRDTQGCAESTFNDREKCGGEAKIPEETSTTSSLFQAWPPLSCVVERYSHHVLSRRRRKVICLADSGVLDTYHFGPAKGEASMISSREIDLHANGATATSMCLLPDTPACILAALEHLFRSHSLMEDPFYDRPAGGAAIGEVGDDENSRNSLCGRIGRRKQASQVVGEKADQVVAIGTSHGGVILVETVVNGTTLDFVEGVFTSKVVHMAFCYASTDDAIRISEMTPCAQDGRLVCMGYDTNGTVAVKGLAISSLTEMFSIQLIEVPTYVRVASKRPILAAGYTDGSLNAVNFEQDRVTEPENGQLIGAHSTKIKTIAFSTRYRCMATGSADGYIIIWDLDGHPLHTMHLQSPASAVEFLEVSGELLVSSASGLSSIPTRGWCPLRLLVAKERADRRAAARTRNNNSSTCEKEGHLASEMVQGDRVRLREGEPGVAIPGGFLLRGRRPADQEVRNDAAGCQFTRQNGDKMLNGNSEGSSEMGNGASRERGLLRNRRGKRDNPSGEIAEREWTPPEVADVSGPCRSNRRRSPRYGGGNEAGAPESPGRGDQNKMSILDLMCAKFSSMPTSPPPPSVHTTKRSTRVPHIALPASPPSIIYSEGKRAPEQASIGDQQVQQDERSRAAPMLTPVALPTRGPRPQPGGASSFVNTTPLEIGALDDAPVEGGTGDETPIESEEKSQRGGPVVDNGSVVSPTAMAVGTVTCAVLAETSMLAPARSSSTSLLPLPGNFFDGVVPRVPEVLAMPMGRHDEKMSADKAIDNSDVSIGGRQWSSTIKGRTNTRRLAKNASSVTSRLKQAAGAFALGPAASTNFVVSGLAIQKPAARIESAEPEQGMHAFTEEVEPGCPGRTQDASITETAAEERPRSLHGGLRTRGASHVSATPACDPPSSEKVSPAMTIRRYRSLGRTKQRPGSISPSSLPGCGIGAGTVAAVAAKDVHNIMPPISTPRAIVKPFVVEDLMSLVSRSTLPPSPPAPSISGRRASGVISPRSWSADGGDYCRLPSSAGAQKGEGRLGGYPYSTGNSFGLPVPGSSSPFFPVRSRAGRRISAIFRGRKQMEPQS